MTLPPASANRSSILALTSGDAPQPQSSPKVMVPSATSEIRTPDLPKSLYLTRFPHVVDGQPSASSLHKSAGGAACHVPTLRHGAQLHQRPGVPGSRRARIDATGGVSLC